MEHVIKSSHITEMWGRATAQKTGRRPLTAEAGVPSHGSPYENCDGQSESGTGFSFPQSVVFHQCTTFFHSSITFPSIILANGCVVTYTIRRKLWLVFFETMNGSWHI